MEKKYLLLKYTFILTIILFSTNHIYCQKNYSIEDSLTSFGFFAGYGYNMHYLTTPSNKSNYTFRTDLKSEGDYGPYFGLLYELPLPQNFYIGLRAEYSIMDGSFSKEYSTLIRQNSDTVAGIYKYEISSKISDFAFEPYLSYNFASGLRINAGGHIGLLTQKKYKQSEKIIEPYSDAFFLDTNTNIRNVISGKIPSHSNVYGGIFAGLSYDIPLNKKKSIIFAPEINFTAGMTVLDESVNWVVNSIKLGFSLRYTPKSDLSEIDTLRYQRINIDTIEIKQKGIKNSFVKLGRERSNYTFYQSGSKVTIVDIIDRTDTLFIAPILSASIIDAPKQINLLFGIVNENFPLLPVVFFKKYSADIEDYYKLLNNKYNFSKEDIKPSPFEYQKNVLNFIGKRLYENSDAVILIKGYSCPVTENGNCELARRRAEVVRDYFINIWGVLPKQVSISTDIKDCSPLTETQTKDERGFSENRRVEIYSIFSDIITPIDVVSYIEPSRITSKEFNFEVSNSALAGSWDIKGLQGDLLLFSQKDTIRQNTIGIALQYDSKSKIQAGKSVVVTYSVYDSFGNYASDEIEIPVNADTTDVKLNRFSLLLFDVDSYRLSAFAKKEIENFIQKAGNSMQIKISGYTDILGNLEKNKILSQNRANTVAEYIRSIAPNVMITGVEGLGSEQFPPGISSYNTPVERFLSRTVLIEILNKIQ